MKKLATLLLAAGMVVAASAPASAADIKVGGFHAFTFETGNTGFKGANDEEFLQRTRLNLTIAASENLKGFVEFQMGTDKWGDYYGKHSKLGDGTGDKHGRYNVQTRQAYVDWTIPATPVKVRMGRSCFG
ncbi:MAG: porin, partial [Mailhella sp.]|nr:porin [Mailhella sp.]